MIKKRTIKKLFAFVLISIICIESSLLSYAQENNNINLATNIIEIDLNSVKEILENDPLVAEVSLINNILEYTTTDGTTASIESGHQNGIQLLQIVENGIEDTVSIDENNNKLYLNDEEVVVDNIIEEVPQNRPVPYVNYTLLSTTHPNITAEQAIKDITTAALFTLMFSALGGIGVALSIAEVIIAGMIAANSLSKTVYVTRWTYHDDMYTTLRYDDFYYRNSNYTGFLEDNTTYVYQ